MTKQVFCDDEKCTLENMPSSSSGTVAIKNQTGSGGLDPEDSSYLIPLRQSSVSLSRRKSLKRRQKRQTILSGGGRKKRRTRRTTTQFGRGTWRRKLKTQIGKGRKRKRKSISHKRKVGKSRRRTKQIGFGHQQRKQRGGGRRRRRRTAAVQSGAGKRKCARKSFLRRK